MNKYVALFLLAGIFTAPEIQAQSCRAVDLRNRSDSPLASLPIEQQGNQGTCYSYAAATQTNYYLLARGSDPSAEVSPLELAIVNSTISHDTTLNGGWSNVAINGLRANGSYCPRQHLQAWLSQHIGPASESKMISILQGSLSPQARFRFMRNIERFRRNYRVLSTRASSPPVSMLSSSTLARQRLREHETTVRRGRQLLAQALPDICVDCSGELNVLERGEHYRFMDTMVRWLMSNEDASEAEIFGEIVDIACEGHRLPANLLPLATGRRRMSNSILVERLNDSLDRAQAVPPALSFCARVLTQPNYRGVELTPGDSRNQINGEECGSHEVLVIARRQHPVHGCQYLIRNSWGTSPTGNYHSSFEFEDGGAWLTTQQIQNNTFQLSQLSAP